MTPKRSRQLELEAPQTWRPTPAVWAAAEPPSSSLACLHLSSKLRPQSTPSPSPSPNPEDSMVVKIRLSRFGKRRQPIYNIVVSQAR